MVLLVLLVLSIAGLVLSFWMNGLVKNKANRLYGWLAVLQGACLGGMFGLLLVLVLLGAVLTR
ncbi:hypothetical protein EGCR1_00635 [Enterococcus gilvus]|nr:hypothetical protein EGCR1_00635 [Enterococcus gilvus]